jgi:hypothetical protein
MKYHLNLAPTLNMSAPPVTGANIFTSTPASGFAATATPRFRAWQPSTWPNVPPAVDEQAFSL